jgi:hypothetical protein
MWVKSDDNKPLNLKVRPLSDAAYRLDDHALHFCARHETDGIIHVQDLDEILLGLKGKHPQLYISELVNSRLWHQPGESCESEECPAFPAPVRAACWVKHDYFVFNKTHAELEEVRASDRRRKRIPAGVPPESRQPPTTPSRPVPSRPVRIVSKQEGMEVQDAMSPNGDGEALILEPAEPKPKLAFDQVWDAWLASLALFAEQNGKRVGKKKLDAVRRRRINEALKDYPLEDVLDAVDGWRFNAHHRGENDAGKPWNDLELLLRNAKMIEQFRDFKRNSQTWVPANRKAREAEAYDDQLREVQEHLREEGR